MTPVITAEPNHHQWLDESCYTESRRLDESTDTQIVPELERDIQLQPGCGSRSLPLRLLLARYMPFVALGMMHQRSLLMLVIYNPCISQQLQSQDQP